jgi:cytochrome c oxidase subunit 4
MTTTDLEEPAEHDPAPRGSAEAREVEDPHAAHERTHPPDREYIMVALILGIITAAEVATYYFDFSTATLVLLLIPMMIAKFAIVAMFFMHLRFDSKVFSAAFVFGLGLAAGVYIVALSTMHFWQR